MNKNILYTLAILFVSILSSCVEKELFEPELKQPEDNGPIVFAASLKGFKETALGTRAGEDVFIPEMFENTIYNALFMMFDHAGILRVKGNATVDSDTGMVSYNIGRDALSVFPKFTICFLANVSEDIYDDFVVNETTWNALQNYYYSVSYALYSETGTVGVPNKADLNGDGFEEYALPMFGSKEVTSPYNSAADYTFEMERLFARIDIKLSLGIEADRYILTSEPQFSLMDCTVNNIPTGIPIAKKDGATAYATNDDSSLYATGELTSFTNFKYIIYTGQEDSLYFYVPEHKLALESSSRDPKNKPNLVSGNMKPIYAAISGFLSDNTDTYETTYNIYLGENSYNNFDLKRNTRYINHVSIKGVADSLKDYRVEIDKMEEMVDDLGEEGKTANCYIIEGNGTYMLPAYRGAYTLPDINAEMCDRGTNTVLICDNPDITITIDPRLSKQSTIVFTVTGVTTGNTDVTPNTGNAVIARIKDNGEIDWSWHLWFVGNNSFSMGDVDLGDWTSNIVKDQTLPDNTTSMMDRNLGTHSTVWTANPGVDLGLYYQYGRKEPYIGGSPVGGGTLEGNTSWNRTDNKKSPTDPCPAGYRVPSQSVWGGTNDTNATKAHFSGQLARTQLWGAYSNPQEVSVFKYWNNGRSGATYLDKWYNDDINFPYGFLRNSTLTDTIPFNISDPESAAADYKYTNLIEEKRETSGFMGTTITTTRKYAEYTDVTYTYSGTARVGAFLSQEGIIPFITYLNIENFQLYSYSYCEHTQVHKTTISDWAGTTTDSYTKPETVYGKQVDAIVNQLKSRLPASHIGSECPENIISYNSNDRYQLRCVKE